MGRGRDPAPEELLDDQPMVDTVAVTANTVNEDESEFPMASDSSALHAVDDQQQLNFRSGGTVHRLLYMSYFLAAWGDRMWEFAGVVFLLDLFPDNLLPASLFGLLASLSGIFTGPSIGRYIDNNNRLKVIRTSCVGQNVCVCAASLLYYAALAPLAPHLGYRDKIGVFCFLTLMEVFSKVFSSMNKISLHKDWIVVIGGGVTARQASFNAAMRRVDLTCSIVAPLAVGVGSATIGDAFTCIGIAAWSFTSLFVEFFLNKRVYDTYPALHRKHAPSTSDRPRGFVDVLRREGHNLRGYFKHPCFLRASLSYCLLYCSLLSFAGITVSFLMTRGVGTVWLAVGRGIAALVAVGSTFATPHMIPRLGLWTTGRICMWLQTACLSPLPFMFIFFQSYTQQSSTMFVVTMFVSLCASRFGLWGFDLAETQIMQELVPKESAGVVNGGQETLMNACYVLSFLYTVAAPNPDQFVWPVCLSFASVFAATIIFSIFGRPPNEGTNQTLIADYSPAPREADETAEM